MHSYCAHILSGSVGFSRLSGMCIISILDMLGEQSLCKNIISILHGELFCTAQIISSKDLCGVFLHGTFFSRLATVKEKEPPTVRVRDNSGLECTRANSAAKSEILFNQQYFIHNSINCFHSLVLKRPRGWIYVQELHKRAPSFPKFCQNLIKHCQSNSFLCPVLLHTDNTNHPISLSLFAGSLIMLLVHTHTHTHGGRKGERETFN